MKVGMVVHAYYLKDARVRRYAELLAALGHEVDVVCLRERNESPAENYMGVTIHRVDLSRVRGGKVGHLFEYFASFLYFFVKIHRLYFTGRKFDIYHIHNMPNILVFCALVPRLMGRKVILDIHDPMPEVFQSKYHVGRRHWLTVLHLVEEWISTRFASALITANHAFRDIMVERGNAPEKITVVMNAPDKKFFAAADLDGITTRKRNEFHVIYIGTVAERYGIEIAVRALGKLNRENAIPGLKFSIIPKIANEGSHLDHVLKEVRQAGLEDCFNLLQPVPHDEMPNVIRSADLLVYSPVPDVHMDIALSLKIPEVIAVGRPIVSSRLEVVLRYFGEDALYLFEPGNVDECAAQILRVYNDPSGARARIEKARQRLAEISWEKQAQNYLELLAGLGGEDMSGERRMSEATEK